MTQDYNFDWNDFEKELQTFSELIEFLTVNSTMVDPNIMNLLDFNSTWDMFNDLMMDPSKYV